MPKATPFSVIAGGLRGYTEGKRWREETEEKKRQDDLQEKLAQLQLELRRMQIQKPMVSSQGIMEWQPGGDFHQPQPGADYRERQAGWGWKPFEKEAGTDLTPEQKAQLRLKYDKKWWDYQVGHPKPTKGGKAKEKVPGIVEEYPKAMKQWQSLTTEIRKYEGTEIDIPPQLRAEEARLRTWMQANRSAYYKARGIDEPKVRPLGEVMMEAAQKLQTQYAAGKITAIEMTNKLAQLRKEWQEASQHWPSMYDTAR